jgi:activator of HSP90 ATPase
MKTESIRQSRVIPAAPAEVYEAFVNARKHAAFTGAGATGVARAGARFTAWDGYITGKHLELDKGKRLVQEWSTSEWPEGAPPSRLEFHFAPHPKGTKVTMVQTSIPAGQAIRYKQGWIDFYWKPLEAYFQARQ